MSIDLIADVGHIVIEPLRDPLERPEWMPAGSNDLLAYATPIIGPTCALIVHRFGTYFAAGYDWHQFDLAELAATFGIGGNGASSPLLRSLQRIDRFGFGRLVPGAAKLQLRPAIPPLSRQMASRIPAYLADTCPYLVR